MVDRRGTWTEALSASELESVRIFVLCGGDVAAHARRVGVSEAAVRRELAHIGALVAESEPSEVPEVDSAFPVDVAARIVEIYNRVVDECP